MRTGTARGDGARTAAVTAVAVAAAVLVTVWWGVAGLGTENFGSDCVFRFGESGPLAERCRRVNDRAEDWLPWLVGAAWAGAALVLVLPRRHATARRAVAAATVTCLVVAVALGVHAMAVARP